MKYRTKPIEVEAISVADVVASAVEDLPGWLHAALDNDDVRSIGSDGVNLGDYGRGYVIAGPGDWLVYHGQHRDGYADIRKVRAADFATTYEPVE